MVMRILIFAVLFTLPALSYTQSSNLYLEFEATEMFLGPVKKGENVDSTFRFKNISVEDVIIDLVSTCECTEAKWPKSAIKPGESGEIHFTFDSSKKETEEELSIDVFLQNLDKNGNPTAIFLAYTYEYK